MIRLLWDASALTKAWAQEEGSEVAATLFDAARPAHAITYLGYAETAAVLLRKFNSGRIKHWLFHTARQKLRDSVLMSPRFEMITIEDVDILAGMALTDRHDINTSDAAILAAYLRLTRFPDGEETFLVVSDHRLERAARAEGMATLDPARVPPEHLPRID